VPDPRGRQQIKRIIVATDRSETATRAVDWAAEMADRYGAELHVVQVLVPEQEAGTEAGQAEATRASFAAEELKHYVAELAGPRGHARVVVDTDPAMAIVRAAEEAQADLLVVGNAGMAGRQSFLLGNVPNRISHNARCSVVIVNTTDGAAGVRTRAFDIRSGTVAAPTEEAEVDAKLLGRATRIGTVMAKHGVKYLFARGDKDEEAVRVQARRLREAMEELGPTFAKLGQILSTRPDLLPPEFIEELATLQDQVPPLTEAQVVQVMEQELGVPWEDVFESIEPKPMAAGTIAQVHKATMADGSRVVIKVQRPNAETDIMQDLGLFKLFAEKTENRPAFRQVIDIRAIVEHLSESLKRELDFTQEFSNIERMRTVLEPYDHLDVPDVYKEYTTPRLLVMQEIQGVAIRQSEDSPARKEAAKQLLESYYRQILTDGFFHADPHPGNLMWQPDEDRLYFLDLGMAGEVGSELRESMMLLLMAFWQDDVGFLTDVTLMMAGAIDRSDLDVEKFQGEIGQLMAKYQGASIQDIQLGPVLQEMTEISLRYGVPLPASLTLTAKALAQMQLAASQLDPTVDPFDVAGKFLMRSVLTGMGAKFDPKALFYQLQRLKVRGMRVVEAVERLIGARPGQKLEVNFRAASLEQTVRRAGRRLAIGLVAAAALLGAAITTTSDRVKGWVPATLGAIGVAFVILLFADLIRDRRPR
jgi:ubiquinone biosynthesis protein